MSDAGNIVYDVVIVGGGPAGLAAAISAHDSGAKEIMILERDSRLGGILLQCIHNGFGLHYFGEELTGPEYAGRFVKQVLDRNIAYKVNTMAISIDKADDFEGAENVGEKIEKREHVVTAMNSVDGLMFLRTRTVILAMGCRERTRGALVIPGTRPAGIFTAGSAQRFVNIDGYLPGKKIVILGSGDIGLIMARRLTLEGCDVKVVCEVMPYSAGLSRNMTQCLENFDIPLKLSTTVVEIHGRERVTGVTIAKVDASRRPIKGMEEYIACDTLLLSVGLIPENEVSVGAGVHIDPVTKGPSVNQLMETSIPGIFACGNTVHVHDLVDFVTTESILAGNCAAEYATQGAASQRTEKAAITNQLPIRPGNRVRYTVPQHIDIDDAFKAKASAKVSLATEFASQTRGQQKQDEPKVQIMFRSTDVYRGITVTVYSGNDRLYSKKARIVRPGEMQIAEVPATSILKATAPLTVSIETPEDTID